MSTPLPEPLPRVNPLVSVVIPCRNAAPWVEQTIASVLLQTHRPLEIIAVDDQSTDATPSLLQRHAESGPGLFRLVRGEGRGAAAARNRGFAVSRGAYVKFLDADDLLSPDTVAAQVSALATRPRHVAHSAWARFRDSPDEARFVPRAGWHDSAEPLDWICETWEDTEPMYQCGMFLLPRPLLEQAGPWDERLTLIDDFEFFTRVILNSAGIVHTPQARLFYRSSLPDSLSGQRSRRAWESAVLSTRLATGHVLQRENSPRTRRLAANMFQQLVHSLHPAHPDLVGSLLEEVAQLGGADVLPGGGRGFRLLARLAGWRAAFAARRLLRR
ncbi:MAG: glycosyl transferase family 2 [Opitutus sp.]|nr:glycosyl transferase family 2 [Opitutus sp.]